MVLTGLNSRLISWVVDLVSAHLLRRGMNLQDLRKTFDKSLIDWRIGTSGLKKNGEPWATVLAYIDARTVMNRLDGVLGPENWRDEYKVLEHGIECTLYIRIGDEWVGKTDASPETNVEALKGGYSKALVRAAVKWGVGRYLYDLGKTFAVMVDSKVKGANYAVHKDKKTGKTTPYFWIPPEVLK